MTDHSSDSAVITEDDIETLNQRVLFRTLDVVRRATTVMFVVAGLIVLAWLWTVLRSQGVIDTDNLFSPVSPREDALTLMQRLDYLATTLYPLGTAALVAGVALGIRTYCTVALVHAGGNVSGLHLGDPLDTAADAIELDRP